MSEIKGCMNCGNISCKNNKKRESKGCGRYISPEDKIKELEKEVTRLRNENLDIINKYTRFAETDRRTIAELEEKLEQTEKDLADYQFNYPTIQELEAEVKEWKDKADLWCKTANLKDHNIMINKELEKENAELKEELKKWKDEWQEQVQKATDEGYARTLQTIQLTKAKEIILRLYNAGRDVLMCRAEEKAYDNLSNAINDKSIEQFLSEDK